MYQLKRRILRLLEEDEEFRYTIAGIIGYKDIIDRLERHDRKFNEILERLDRHTAILEEHTRQLAEHTKKLEEHDRKFNEILERLDRHTAILEEHTRQLAEHTKKLEEHDRKFEEILEEIARLRKDFTDLSRRVEVTIGSMGRRWGMDLEKTVLEIFRETLERRGIEPGRVEKFRYKDVDGRVTGVKGKIVDVDVLVRDGKLYVIEVKSMAELDHVELLPEKARVVQKIMGKPVEKTLIVAVNIAREAYERAKQLGIEVVAGNIID